MGAGVTGLLGRQWTLFLDRDGVINRRVHGDYVRSWAQFEFLPGAREALARLSKAFTTIVVVTNQRGVGRGLMTEADLAAIHDRMVAEVAAVGGRIDGVYHCPHDLDAACDCRKPGTGLVRQAVRQHPAIDLGSAVVVGDSDSDMAVARQLGTPGVLVQARAARPVRSDWDAAVGSLLDFSVAVDRGFACAAPALE